MTCPVCGVSSFDSESALAFHVESHFSQGGPKSSGRPVEVRGSPEVVVISDSDDDEECKKTSGAAQPIELWSQGLQAPMDGGPGMKKQRKDEEPAGPRGHVPVDVKDIDGVTGDGLVLCPSGCDQWILMSDLDSHLLLHQLQEEEQHADENWLKQRQENEDAWDCQDMFAVDARQLQEAADFEALQSKYGFSSKRPGKCFTCGEEGHWSTECPKNPRVKMPTSALSTEPSRLASQQQPDPHWQRQHQHQQAGRQSGQPKPLMQELGEVLREQAQLRSGYCAFLSGPVEHFSAQYSDRGWGCGWRNIQMVLSHLLLREQQQEALEQEPARAGPGPLSRALFQGSLFVPDIAALQAWLEVSWEDGFDVAGCESLGGKIQCSRKWIGTTEAATLLRYFNVKAHIVDFPGVKSKPCHPNVECDLCGCCPIMGSRHRSLTLANYDLCSLCVDKAEAQVARPFQVIEAGAGPGADGAVSTSSTSGSHRAGSLGATAVANASRSEPIHAPLVRWVWDYFTGNHLPTRHLALAPSSSPPTTAGSADTSQLNLLGRRNPLSIADAPSSEEASASGQPRSSQGLEQQQQQQQQQPRRPKQVFATGLPPLYFQHEGHSRTIVGIERYQPDKAGGSLPVTSHGRPAARPCDTRPISSFFRKADAAGQALPARGATALGVVPSTSARTVGDAGTAAPGGAAEDGFVYNLLVLDPSVDSASLREALRAKKNWQRLLRRGVHTLRLEQYQLMYIDVSRVATEAERQGLRLIKASETVWPTTTAA